MDRTGGMPTATWTGSGSSTLGSFGCRWKKFHFLGDLARFSNFFALVPFRPRSSGCDSSDIRLDCKLLTEGEAPMPERSRGLGKFKAPVELLSFWIERRTASDGGCLPSSLLSDGRRPLGMIADALFEGSLGIADGQRVAREWLGSETFDSTLGLPLSNKRLVLLSVLDNSELAFLFSKISPPPAIMTGLIRSSKNGS